MLDFRTIISDVHGLADKTSQRAEARREQMARAVVQARLDDNQWAAEHAGRIESARTKWLLGRPISRRSIANACADAPEAQPDVYTAIAVDGSQIAPDRHEIAACYLLNIGRAALHYGGGDRPTLESTASLYYDDADLYMSSDQNGDADEGSFITERDLATKRLLAEIDALRCLIDDCAGRKDAVAFLDGPLVLWTLEAEPDDLRKKALDSFLETLDLAERCKVPVVGYVSRPASREAVGALRVSLCPDPVVHCKTCRHGDTAPLPCAPLDRLRDIDLFGSLLAPGRRSGMFASTSHVLRFYKPAANKIAFFYVNTGSEIARIEAPRWVVDDPALLDRCHAVVLDQARKGMGYPICLTEAHQQAVVRAPDRDAFFRLVERALTQKRLPALRTAKTISKRRPMI